MSVVKIDAWYTVKRRPEAVGLTCMLSFNFEIKKSERAESITRRAVEEAYKQINETYNEFYNKQCASEHKITVDKLSFNWNNNIPLLNFVWNNDTP